MLGLQDSIDKHITIIVNTINALVRILLIVEKLILIFENISDMNGKAEKIIHKR